MLDFSQRPFFLSRLKNMFFKVWQKRNEIVFRLRNRKIGWTWNFGCSKIFFDFHSFVVPWNRELAATWKAPLGSTFNEDFWTKSHYLVTQKYLNNWFVKYLLSLWPRRQILQLNIFSSSPVNQSIRATTSHFRVNPNCHHNITRDAFGLKRLYQVTGALEKDWLG